MKVIIFIFSKILPVLFLSCEVKYIQNYYFYIVFSYRNKMRLICFTFVMSIRKIIRNNSTSFNFHVCGVYLKTKTWGEVSPLEWKLGEGAGLHHLELKTTYPPQLCVYSMSSSLNQRSTATERHHPYTKHTFVNNDSQVQRLQPVVQSCQSGLLFKTISSWRYLPNIKIWRLSPNFDIWKYFNYSQYSVEVRRTSTDEHYARYLGVNSSQIWQLCRDGHMCSFRLK